MDLNGAMIWCGLWIAAVVAYAGREIYLRRRDKSKPSVPPFGAGDFSHQFSAISSPALTTEQADEAFLLGLHDSGNGIKAINPYKIDRLRARGWIQVDITLTPEGAKKLKELM